VEQFRVDTYSTKEPETLDWLDEELRDGDVFFDVGANIGLYSLYAAKRRPSAQVIAFEPAYHNFARLCRNVALNGCANVLPCNVPLAESDRLDVFHTSDTEAGSALNAFGGPSAFRAREGATLVKQWALSVSLDQLVSQYDAPVPTLLKIDVDGIEEQILAGAESVLARPTLRGLLIEWNVGADGADVEALERRLAPLGLVLARRSDWCAEHSGIRSQNLIFSRGQG
jgi:FkbM family methyltransferase